MTSMIEKVAKALYDQDGCPELENPKRWAVEQIYWMEMARAAIAAMREPTPEMIEAGDNEGIDRCSHDAPEAEDIAGIYRSMIDAALDPHPPHEERPGDGDHPGDNPAEDKLHQP